MGENRKEKSVFQGPIDPERLLEHDLRFCADHETVTHETDIETQVDAALGLVAHEARQAIHWPNAPETLSVGDLFSAGSEALLKAVGPYKKGHSSRAKLTTYAYVAIKGAIAKTVRQENKQTKFSRRALPLEHLVKIEPSQPWGTMVTETWNPLREVIRNREFFPKTGELKLVADPPPDPEKALLIEERRKTIDQALARLKPRYREVLEWRFGLIDGCSQTLEEVGERLDITDERVRIIQDKALRKLRNSSAGRRLKEFVEY